MRVWVVVGEYKESRNGVVSWVAGVAKTKKRAVILAREDAEATMTATGDPDERVLIDGDKFGESWRPNDEEGTWTISYGIAEHEVMGSSDERA